jgi:hypothetical protein
MEHHAQSVDDALIGGLSYKLKAGASYVTNRRSVSFFPQGGNSYSPNGVKVIKFNLTGDQWLDPSTFRIHFQLNNDNPALALEPLSWNPAVFFRRVRLLGGGQVIEDIDSFNRLSMMLQSVASEKEQMSIAAEGFGSYDERVALPADDHRKTFLSADHDKAGAVGESRRVLFKPHLGLLNQDKLIPIRYLPLQIELELVSNSTDCVYVSALHSSSWTISDCQVKCDLLTLDNALDNEYAALLLSGKSLPINFSSWNHTVQQTGGDKNFSVNISRALTRLKSVFVTLHKEGADAYLKECNQFYHPALNYNVPFNNHSEHQYWIQIGSQKWPEYPILSSSESYYQLQKTVGPHMNIFQRWYRGNKYIIGIDTEKISGAGFTGLNTKAGDLLTINFRDCDNNGVAASIPEKMFCALHYDAILNIRDNGVEVLE